LRYSWIYLLQSTSSTLMSAILHTSAWKSLWKHWKHQCLVRFILSWHSLFLIVMMHNASFYFCVTLSW
jgi:hypothetical protein